MKKSLFFVAAAMLLMTSCKKAGNEPMREVYYNAKIYTADSLQPEATALVIEEGKIVYVGNDTEALAMVKADSLRHDVGQKRIIPGLIDAHCHFIILGSVASGKKMLTIDSGWSHEETLKQIKKWADENPDVKQIYGMGWGPNVKPSAAELDKLGIDRPIVLNDIDGHTAWVNSAALKAAGVDRNYKDIAPGASYFERDKDGNPNGIVREPSQCSWLTKKLKFTAKEDIKKGLPILTGAFNAAGITAVYDAGLLGAEDEDGLQAVVETNPTIRIFASVLYDGSETPDEYAARASKLMEQYQTDMLRANTMKVFKDGTTDAGTSLVYKPFTKTLDKKQGTGNCITPNEKLQAVAEKAANLGMNIHVHTIGDRAVSETLDVMHNLGQIKGTKTLAHCELLSNGAFEKFIENEDVFCTTTPIWNRASIADNQIEYLGEEEFMKYHIPVKDLIDSGKKVTFSSDVPASRDGFNPMNNIWAAACEGIDPEILDRKGKNLSIAQCIDSYTIRTAEQVGAQDEIGSLTAGKWADFVILNQDIFQIDPRTIRDVKVENTFLKGEIIYSLEEE
ncbi:MAG: amidohydrolase [Bacteroidales bacterium]|nr:amidohydrolase [Bacteroidales bacterium]